MARILSVCHHLDRIAQATRIKTQDASECCSLWVALTVLPRPEIEADGSLPRQKSNRRCCCTNCCLLFVYFVSALDVISGSYVHATTSNFFRLQTDCHHNIHQDRSLGVVKYLTKRPFLKDERHSTRIRRLLSSIYPSQHPQVRILGTLHPQVIHREPWDRKRTPSGTTSRFGWYQRYIGLRKVSPSVLFCYERCLSELNSLCLLYFFL